MDEKQAREILSDYIQPDNGLCNAGSFIWLPGDSDVAFLSCSSVSYSTSQILISTKQIEAIAWWVNNIK